MRAPAGATFSRKIPVPQPSSRARRPGAGRPRHEDRGAAVGAAAPEALSEFQMTSARSAISR